MTKILVLLINFINFVTVLIVNLTIYRYEHVS